MGKLIVISKSEPGQKPTLVKRDFGKNIVTVNLVNGTARSTIGNGKTAVFHSSPPGGPKRFF